VDSGFFSSFPGTVFSIGDFYVRSSGPVAQETTIENFNKSLLSFVRLEKIVLQFMRNIVANRIAKSGHKFLIDIIVELIITSL
jgi:hypothetical protein